VGLTCYSVATLGRWQVGPDAVVIVRRCHLLVATVNMKHSRLFEFLKSEVSRVTFLKTFHHSKNLQRLTVKDKNLPTPTKLNRVDKFLSSTVDSYCLWIVRIFNIISLYFVERCGINLLLSVASLSHWQAGPVALATGR
jgi:hypothetical protein